MYAPGGVGCVRFVAVYTAQGLGYVVLPWGEAGWGGRRMVEVWMRAGVGGVGVVKVMAMVGELTVIPIMPPSMLDMVRASFAGVRHATPLQGREGGHRGKRSLIDVGAGGVLTDPALVEELNARYRHEVRSSSLDGAPPGRTPSPSLPNPHPPSAAFAASHPHLTHPTDTHVPPPLSLPLLRLGHLLHLWRGVVPDVTRQAVLVFLDEHSNRLYWHDATQPRTLVEGDTLRLEGGLRVVKGRVAGSFPEVPYPGVDDTTCFTLLSPTARLSLQAISGGAREEWLAELGRWVEYRSRMRRPVAAAGAFVPPAIPPAHQLQGGGVGVVSGAGGVSGGVFGVGGEFVSYGVGQAPQRVWVWYDAASSRLGSIFWVRVEEAGGGGERKGHPDRRIPLVSLCDLTIGKGGDGWTSEEGRQADAWRCFSLKTKKAALNLEASRPDVRDAWVQHIKSTIANAGKKVIDAEEQKYT